jgi:uncharacterized protein (UPF0332 family)
MPPFTWTEFLALAKSLSQNTDEASLRSAVSRAYYSVFNVALARAEERGYRPKGDARGGMHDLLWQMYERNEDDVCRQISVLGPRMKRRRVIADYKTLFSRPLDQANDAITEAEKCHELLSQLAQGLPVDEPRKWSL